MVLICVNFSYAQESKPANDTMVIQIVELDYADAEQLASVLRPFLSKGGQIIAYRPTNSLIIKDKKSIVEALIKVIKGKFDPSDR